MTPTEIKALRFALGWNRPKKRLTLQQFSDLCGCTISTVAMWESGARKPSTFALQVLRRLQDSVATTAERV